MKSTGQGKKEWVVVILQDDGTKRIASLPMTIKKACWLVNDSSLPLEPVAVSDLQRLGIHAPFETA